MNPVITGRSWIQAGCAGLWAALIDGKTTVRRQAPVFGCALNDSVANSAGTGETWKR
jgi:hypothetical protein